MLHYFNSSYCCFSTNYVKFNPHELISFLFLYDYGRLTKRDLAVVLNYLVEIKRKWFDVGIQLDLDPEELE